MLTHSKKFSIILSVLLALGLLFTAAPGQVSAGLAISVNNGTFSGPLDNLTDPNAVNAYKTTAGAISLGNYQSDTEFLVMEGMKISFDGSSYVTDRGGDIYVQTVVSGLQSGDIVEIDNNYFYNEGSGPYSYWDQAPYWIQIGDYTHAAVDTINNWLIYIEKINENEYRLVVGSGLFNLANYNDDLTTIIGQSFKLTRDVKVFRGATLTNPTTSSRGYISSTHETPASWDSPVNQASYDTGDLKFIGVHTVYVDDDWTGNSNGDVVNGHIFGQDAFSSIKTAISATVDGGTILVGPGTYNETAPLTLSKENLTVQSVEGASKTIVDLQGSGLFNGVEVFANLGDVTLDGFTVKDFTQDGIKQSYTQKQGTAFHVLNNIVIPADDYLRNGIEVTGDGSTVVGNVVYGKLLTEDWASCGIQVDDASNVDVLNNTIFGGPTTVDYGICVAAWDYDIDDVLIQGNHVTNADTAIGLMTGGLTPQTISNISVLANTFENSGTGIAATTTDEKTLTLSGNFQIESNKFLSLTNEDITIAVDVVKSTSLIVDASPNWFGSIAGPATGKIFGLTEFSPWCGDADCSFFVSSNSDGDLVLDDEVTVDEIESAINAAPEGSTIVIPAGTFNAAGGIDISNPGVTILLSDGVVIQNNSPCFNVTANNTTVTTETIGGAKCVPTNGDNGINVAAGVSGVRIIGLEIDGTGQITGDGIHFAGAVTEYQIVDNYVHDLDGDAVEFTVQPAGTVKDIQGNLFKNNTGLGVNNSAGSSAINAQYNSWGHKDGAAAGDGISTFVDAANPTYVELYLVSSGTPWSNQVVKYGQITYTVFANLRNVMGTEFTLTYPTDALGYNGTSYTLGTAFDNQTFTAAANSGTIHFKADNLIDSVNGDAVKLFDVTFEAKNAFGLHTLDLVDATADFSMLPSAGPSTNIYPTILSDGTVKIIELPVLTSTAAASYYLTGVNQEFTISLSNLNGADYAKGVFYYRFLNTDLADIASFQYQEMVQSPVGTWYNMPKSQVGANVEGFWGDPVNGYPLPAGYEGSNPFRITFANPGTYAFELWYWDITAATELVKLTGSTVVYDPPTISTSMSGPFLGEIESQYGVTLTNPATGLSTLVRSKFTLFETLGSEIASLQYFEVQSGTWQNLSVTQVDGDLVGWFGPSTGFPMSNPYDATSQFRITFANGNTKTYSYKVELFDFSAEPDRLLATFEDSFNVYAQYGLTGTFSMQGRVIRSGVPVTLTSTTIGFPYGPWTIFSSDVLGINWSLNDVAIGEYRVTTNQPRYLNVTSDLGKTVTITGAPVTLNSLELKGGNAVWTDNVINGGDASLVGGQYGSLGTGNDGDVNFSGKVDIFDLALVGGNYGLISANAYGAWIP